jgi:hypothetical protein
VRVAELADQLSDLAKTMRVEHSEYSGRYEQVDTEQFLNWCVKARNLIGKGRTLRRRKCQQSLPEAHDFR